MSWKHAVSTKTNHRPRWGPVAAAVRWQETLWGWPVQGLSSGRQPVLRPASGLASWPQRPACSASRAPRRHAQRHFQQHWAPAGHCSKAARTGEAQGMASGQRRSQRLATSAAHGPQWAGRSFPKGVEASGTAVAVLVSVVGCSPLLSASVWRCLCVVHALSGDDTITTVKHARLQEITSPFGRNIRRPRLQSTLRMPAAIV